MEITISKSDRKDKKFKAIVEDNDRKKTVHFGQAGASDMTKHGDEKKKEIYIYMYICSRVQGSWSPPPDAMLA